MPVMNPPVKPSIVPESLPIEVLQALDEADAVPRDLIERRRQPRTRYTVAGRLVVEAPFLWEGRVHVYTHDVNSCAIRFVTRSILAMNTRGTLHVADPGGEQLEIDCVVKRVRPLVPGWWDVVTGFIRKQPAFGEYNMP